MNKSLLVSPQQLCKDIDKAIKIDKEFMYSVDAKVASMSIVLPKCEVTNKKTKWGKINSCSKIYKDLKELKKSVVEYKLATKNGENTLYDDLKLSLACTTFAVKFKETVKFIILSKIVVEKEERAFWDELLKLFDKIGFQLMNDYDLFVSLGRVKKAMEKQKEKEEQEALDLMNFRMQQLQQEQEAVYDNEELEVSENKQEKEDDFGLEK